MTVSVVGFRMTLEAQVEPPLPGGGFCCCRGLKRGPEALGAAGRAVSNVTSIYADIQMITDLDSPFLRGIK
jgi:hypothetical protein